ncbi:poly(A) polymerase, putative [Babesia ovis]|uniref:Poly(A) polymerase, putative n=1 Tax=Babesia ovis TaxID=5869 RepID=A0A9W5TBN3_BABOV|nr:poly(A) polymerase, putative [Babesia ovis]
MFDLIAFADRPLVIEELETPHERCAVINGAVKYLAGSCSAQYPLCYTTSASEEKFFPCHEYEIEDGNYETESFYGIVASSNESYSDADSDINYVRQICRDAGSAVERGVKDAGNNQDNTGINCGFYDAVSTPKRSLPAPVSSARDRDPCSQESAVSVDTVSSCPLKEDYSSSTIAPNSEPQLDSELERHKAFVNNKEEEVIEPAQDRATAEEKRMCAKRSVSMEQHLEDTDTVCYPTSATSYSNKNGPAAGFNSDLMYFAKEFRKKYGGSHLDIDPGNHVGSKAYSRLPYVDMTGVSGVDPMHAFMAAGIRQLRHRKGLDEVDQIPLAVRTSANMASKDHIGKVSYTPRGYSDTNIEPDVTQKIPQHYDTTFANVINRSKLGHTQSADILLRDYPRDISRSTNSAHALPTPNLLRERHQQRTTSTPNHCTAVDRNMSGFITENNSTPWIPQSVHDVDVYNGTDIHRRVSPPHKDHTSHQPKNVASDFALLFGITEPKKSGSNAQSPYGSIDYNHMPPPPSCLSRNKSADQRSSDSNIPNQYPDKYHKRVAVNIDEIRKKIDAFLKTSYQRQDCDLPAGTNLSERNGPQDKYSTDITANAPESSKHTSQMLTERNISRMSGLSQLTADVMLPQAVDHPTGELDGTNLSAMSSPVATQPSQDVTRMVSPNQPQHVAQWPSNLDQDAVPPNNSAYNDVVDIKMDSSRSGDVHLYDSTMVVLPEPSVLLEPHAPKSDMLQGDTTVAHSPAEQAFDDEPTRTNEEVLLTDFAARKGNIMSFGDDFGSYIPGNKLPSTSYKYPLESDMFDGNGRTPTVVTVTHKGKQLTDTIIRKSSNPLETQPVDAYAKKSTLPDYQNHGYENIDFPVDVSSIRAKPRNEIQALIQDMNNMVACLAKRQSMLGSSPESLLEPEKLDIHNTNTDFQHSQEVTPPSGFTFNHVAPIGRVDLDDHENGGLLSGRGFRNGSLSASDASSDYVHDPLDDHVNVGKSQYHNGDMEQGLAYRKPSFDSVETLLNQEGDVSSTVEPLVSLMKQLNSRFDDMRVVDVLSKVPPSLLADEFLGSAMTKSNDPITASAKTVLEASGLVSRQSLASDTKTSPVKDTVTVGTQTLERSQERRNSVSTGSSCWDQLVVESVDHGESNGNNRIRSSHVNASTNTPPRSRFEPRMLRHFSSIDSDDDETPRTPFTKEALISRMLDTHSTPRVVNRHSSEQYPVDRDDTDATSGYCSTGVGPSVKRPSSSCIPKGLTEEELLEAYNEMMKLTRIFHVKDVKSLTRAVTARVNKSPL